MPRVSETPTTQGEVRFVNRRQLVAAGATWALGQLAVGPLVQRGWSQPLGTTGPRISHRALELVQESTVIDMLGLLSLDWRRLVGWLNDPPRFGAQDLERLAASGVDVFHPAVEPAARDPHDAARRWISGWQRLVARSACGLRPVRSVVDLQRSRNNGPLGILIGLQSSEHFRTAADVALFADLGQRVSQLTYNGSSRLGSGCWVLRDSGLTPFGAEVVAAMNHVGMAVDLSHSGERTALDAIEASRTPVLITHSNCRTLVPSQRRNVTDRTIRALTQRGGVLGLTTVRALVGTGRPSIETLLDHFDHVAHLVGIEHVGLGSDVDADGRDTSSGRPLGAYIIEGLDPALRVFQLAEGLLARGYSRADVQGVLGGNFRRALAAIWPAPAAGDRLPPRDPFCPPVLAPRSRS